MRHILKTFLLPTHNLKTDAPGNKLCIKIRFLVMISNLLAKEEGRRKKEEGRRKKEEGRSNKINRFSH
ncbi:hypothetical protein [Microcoleus sp. D2_18a_B4]|uniref:hypothetical protein n=1 Tax=Microcoleus sp. D2_18a_B4 TaxID=3055329 RepID=UPI002FCEE0BA